MGRGPSYDSAQLGAGGYQPPHEIPGYPYDAGMMNYGMGNPMGYNAPPRPLMPGQMAPPPQSHMLEQGHMG